MSFFFDFAPHDPATIVILRHISFDHKSQLYNLLQKHSKLQIVEAVNDTLLEKDTIYMPPSFDVHDY